MTVKSLLIKGDFTENDLREWATTFRKIERRQPDLPFQFVILDADLSMAEAQDVIKRIFPRIENNDPVFVAIPRQLTVFCPDGKRRPMAINFASDFTPIADRMTVIMMQGSVEIDGHLTKGEAWLRDGHYYFKPDA